MGNLCSVTKLKNTLINTIQLRFKKRTFKLKNIKIDVLDGINKKFTIFNTIKIIWMDFHIMINYSISSFIIVHT